MCDERNPESFSDVIISQYNDLDQNVEQMKEAGKRIFFDKRATKEDKRKGFDLLDRAYKAGDYESYYYVGRILISGEFWFVTNDKKKSGKEYGWNLILSSAINGCREAKHFLDIICMSSYEKKFGKNDKLFKPLSGPLKDFDGKVIKINRTGVFTPVDAVLEYKNGRNILTFSTNIHFDFLDYEIGHDELEIFKKAAIDGIKEWEGDYSVFGNQDVKIKVNITTEDRTFDNVTIIPATKTWIDVFGDTSALLKKVPGGDKQSSLLEYSDALTSSGIAKWSVTSRKKIICKPDDNGRFDNHDYIMHIMKHEFGHVLGLGDLYSCEEFDLKGVEWGKYPELDAYKIPGNDYHLVMSDAIGPISNNDIEMVILAFSTNRMQIYQEQGFMKKISEALGKGN